MKNNAAKLYTLKTSVVRSRVSEELKQQSEEILNSLGLSMSDAIRLFLQQMINARTLPFELKPNPQTLESFNAPVFTSNETDGALFLRSLLNEDQYESFND
ncbi:MAG TPA: type II toxin-antitoxin system RelB/DinJ family antitoxin [Tissierellaceae bacterium]